MPPTLNAQAPAQTHVARRAGASPSTSPEPHSLTTAGLTVILIGVLLPMIDFFIVNVALPTIDTDLRASQPLLELVVSGYATAYALLLVLGGRLGDSLGRKRLFLIGMAAFTATSLACGLAPTATFLVIGRVAQGASAAMMVPQVLATIQAATTGQQRTRALGRYGAAGGLAAVLGQVLGGLLVAANIAGLGWRPIFLVNVPIGLAGLVLAKRYVPDTRHGRPHRLTGSARSCSGSRSSPFSCRLPRADRWAGPPGPSRCSSSRRWQAPGLVPSSARPRCRAAARSCRHRCCVTPACGAASC